MYKSKRNKRGSKQTGMNTEQRSETEESGKTDLSDKR